MIQVYVLVTFWDENGLHKAGTFTEVKEEDFNPYYMQKVEGGSGDAYTKAETDALLDAKQDDLTAGTNIQISDQDVISATDTGDTVSYTATQGSTNGAECGKLTINGTDSKIYAPKVQVTQVQSSGTKIATIKVGGTSTDLYAPAGGSGAAILYFSASDFNFDTIATSSRGQIIDYDHGGSPVSGSVIADLLASGNGIALDDYNANTAYLVGKTPSEISGSNYIFFCPDSSNGAKYFAFHYDNNNDYWVATEITVGSGGGGGGSTPTAYNVFDQYDQAMHVSDFLSNSAQTIVLKDSATMAVSFNTLKTAYLAGEVIINCGASGDAGDFKVISVVDSSQQMVTLLCGGSTGTVSRVVLAWQGDRWSKNVNQ